MLSTATRISLWLGATSIVAIGAIAIGNDRYEDVDSALAKACTGSAPTRQLDNALFNSRARTDSGADPICTPADKDDDLAGVVLSHSPNARAEGKQLGFFGDEPRRR
jgi:hypothetical protein